jgi:hypothetical protein
MGPAAGEAREDATWKAIGRTDDCRAAGVARRLADGAIPKRR